MACFLRMPRIFGSGRMGADPNGFGVFLFELQKMMIRVGLCSLVFFLMAFDGIGQSQNHYLSARAHLGFVIVHSRDVRSVKDSYPRGLELDIGIHKTSDRVWESCNCYPKSGIALGFWDFDNAAVLGYGVTAMYYLQPVFRADRRFSFSVRGGMGLSYKSKPHDPVSNPDNQSYSTHFAFPLQLGVAFNYDLNEQWQLDFNAVYNHISNGGLKQPNKGINWPTVALGVTRYFEPMKFPVREKTDWRLGDSPRNRFDLISFFTYHEPVDGYYLLSGGLEVKAARRVGRLSNLTLGAEWMYDTYRTKLEDTNDDGNMLGMALGHEFILGRFLFAQQFGVYFFKPETRPEDVYQRYSLVYRFNETWAFGFALKAHGHVADFADLRLAYTF
jgi:hypothetical protein